MKRFIRYLYEYDQGKRIRNVGFVKVEQTEEKCSVQVHGKGLGAAREETFALAIFYEDGEVCVTFPQGDVKYTAPAFHCELTFTPDDTGIPENYERINGILLESPSGRKYAAVWDGMPVHVDHVRRWAPEPPRQEEPSMPEVPLQPELPTMSEEQPEQPALTEDIPDTQTQESEKLALKVTKIQRREITFLPRCEWQAANNHFLMHGYCNYRHLVLIDDGKTLKLGVPGIYHEKEAKAAESLGFPEFIGLDETRLHLEPEEYNVEERFGYWCRRVKRPPN